MEHLQTSKTVNKKRELPLIIADKKVFAEMTTLERRAFYKSIDDTIDDPKLKRSQNLYKLMCLYPEERLISAFTEGKFKDETKWRIYVAVLEHCLYEHLLNSLPTFQEAHKAYTIEMKRAEKRIFEIQADIKKYAPKIKEVAA